MLSCVLFIVHTIPDNEVLGTVYFFNGKTERYVTVDFNHIKQLNDCTDVTDTILGIMNWLLTKITDAYLFGSQVFLKQPR